MAKVTFANKKNFIDDSTVPNEEKITDSDMNELKAAINANSSEIGDIKLSVAIPNGWLQCNGQAVSRVTYADLFKKIGTKYGAGDGIATFNLPNYPPDLSYTLSNDTVQLTTPPPGVVRVIKAKEVN